MSNVTGTSHMFDEAYDLVRIDARTNADALVFCGEYTFLPEGTPVYVNNVLVCEGLGGDTN